MNDALSKVCYYSFISHFFTLRLGTEYNIRGEHFEDYRWDMYHNDLSEYRISSVISALFIDNKLIFFFTTDVAVATSSIISPRGRSMTRMKRMFGAVGASVLIAAALMMATPTMAQALPGGCTTFVATDGRGYAHCGSGTGYYKVGIGCRPVGPFGQYGFGFTQQGNWARVGGEYYSVAKCPLGTSNWSPTGGAFNAWIDQTAETI